MLEQKFYQENWLTVQEVAEYLRLKCSTIYQYVSDKKIPHYKRGHIVRFREVEIIEWMKEGRVPTDVELLRKQLTIQLRKQLTQKE